LIVLVSKIQRLGKRGTRPFWLCSDTNGVKVALCLMRISSGNLACRDRLLRNFSNLAHHGNHGVPYFLTLGLCFTANNPLAIKKCALHWLGVDFVWEADGSTLVRGWFRKPGLKAIEGFRSSTAGVAVSFAAGAGAGMVIESPRATTASATATAIISTVQNGAIVNGLRLGRPGCNLRKSRFLLGVKGSLNLSAAARGVQHAVVEGRAVRYQAAQIVVVIVRLRLRLRLRLGAFNLAAPAHEFGLSVAAFLTADVPAVFKAIDVLRLDTVLAHALDTLVAERGGGRSMERFVVSNWLSQTLRTGGAKELGWS